MEQAVRKVHQEDKDVLSDTKADQREGQSVEPGDVELSVLLLPADVPHQVANDQEEQDALERKLSPYQEEGELFPHDRSNFNLFY